VTARHAAPARDAGDRVWDSMSHRATTERRTARPAAAPGAAGGAPLQ
jgi:hypothetical protein